MRARVEQVSSGADIKNYLQPGEADDFSQQGVEQSRAGEETVARSKAFLTGGGAIPREEAQRRASMQVVGYNVNPRTGDAMVRGVNPRGAAPVTQEDVVSRIERQYPTVAAAARAADLNEAEFLSHVSFATAVDAATQIATSMNPRRQAQVFNTMGPDMQALVADVLQAWWQDAEAKKEVVQTDSTGNAVLDAVGTAWAYTGSPIFDFLNEANQLAMRSVATLAYSGAGTNMSLPDAWAATAPGQYDEAGLEFARQEYGADVVKTITDIRAAAASGESDAVGGLYKKYTDAGDTRSLEIMDAVLSGTNTDQRVLDAATYVASLEPGNLGNVAFWSMAGMFGMNDTAADAAQAAQSPMLTGVRDVTNVVGTFAFDPTLLAGKVISGYKSARYGLRLLEPGKIDAAFAKPNIRRFFDTLGEGFQRLDKAEDLGQRGQILNSLRSQYKGWFTSDGLDELHRAGVRTADDALEYFRAADHVDLLTRGQYAKRGKQVLIPHMVTATAQAKRVSLLARGLTYDKNAGAKIDAIFGPGVSQMLPEDAIPVIISKLSETDGDQFVGRFLSDFVFADGTAKRTFLGQLPVLNRRGSRYGYKRQGGARARVERVGRNFSHMPMLGDGLRISDGRDAQKVRDLMLYAGMPKYWADFSADLWRQMDTGQRLRFASGMGRSMGYARGVDIVDPVNGRKLIDDSIMGKSQGELYAPDQQDLAALRGQANRQANSSVTRIALTDPAAQSLVGAPVGTTATTADGLTLVVGKKGVQVAKKEAAFKDAVRRAVSVEMDTLKADARWTNPSRAIDQQADATNGLYAMQMTDRIAMPDLNKLEDLSMRQSYLTALLGLNPFVTRAVDVWTLATLAGPRFQLRNGLEDAGLYAATGGAWKGYRAGRLYSTAKREATMRPLKFDKEGKLIAKDARGEKLGIVKSSSRWLGDQMPAALQGLIWPNLDASELVAAQTLAKQGDRSGVVKLINKAMLRGVAKYTRGRVLDAETTRFLDEAGEQLGFFNMMDEVSETARHLADGAAPGLDDVETVVVNGNAMRMVTADRVYSTLKVKRGDPRAVKAWWSNLSMVLHGDRGKGQAAVARIRKYHGAKLRGDVQAQADIVDDFAAWITESAPWVAERSGIAATEGIASFARRNLDDVLRLFTTKSGGFNEDLMKMIRREEIDPETGESAVTYALWDELPDGKREFRVFEQDLAEMKARPQTVLDMQGQSIPVSGKMAIDQRMWAAMGRSLARMTREPIFVSNYLDARQMLAPFEKRIAEDLGPEAAKKWAVEAAYERAYDTSMAFIDNPNVRSQLAWNVRNVARFYRAQEDFFRRMMRVAKYQPETFQKIHLTWRVLDDTGFVSTDEYGDQYFIWPGSRMAFQAINKITSAMGLPVAEAGLPMSFVSRAAMLTPSADPNSWWPTMSSPFATLGLRPLMGMFPALQSLQQEIFGEYSTNTAIWMSVLPANVTRPLEYLMANAAGSESRQAMNEGMYASSARSAIQAYAAAGLFDESKQLGPAELSDMRRTIDVAAMDIMGLKMVLAPVMPAAIQASPDTVSDFARSVGVDGMRELFVQVMKANDGDINAAMVQWMSANPGQSIFTVSANTNGDYVGNYGPFRETIEWIDGNKDVVDKHPVGAAFFAPQEGTQNLAAWTYLRAMGAKVPKDVESYFNEVATSQGYSLYRIYKTQYDQAVAEGRKDEVQGAWDRARADLYSRFPMLSARVQGEMKTTDTPSKAFNVSDMEDYRGALSMVKAKGQLDERGWYAEQVINMYDEARSTLAQMSDTDPAYADNKAKIREMWVRMIDDMKTRYVDDRQWESLLYTASGALGYKVTL